MKKKNYVLGGMMGLVVGDALGVPVEFQFREKLQADPVTGMREFGTHFQPAGTWSDDSSMAIASMDSLCEGLDLKDMLDKFSAWVMYGDYTPYGKVFDVGVATSQALMNYGRGTAPEKCGGRSEFDNGNGSLMRILPVVLFLCKSRDNYRITADVHNMQLIHDVSGLTHAHPRSQVGCGLYAVFVSTVLGSREKETPLQVMTAAAKVAFAHYTGGAYPQEMTEELAYYERLKDMEAFAALPEEAIRSSGYVVETLEAAVWCFLHTSSYRDCVLKAVNLGDDTDTVAAVAGGLAGCFYGYEAIPEEWLRVIPRREWIETMCRKLEENISAGESMRERACPGHA